MPLRVLISHAHDERPLADAWKNLLTAVSMGAIQPWYSSDSQPSGGMTIGQQWRDTLRDRIAESQFILAILSPHSRDRPWILWECGIGSGATGERGVVPVVYSMQTGELANPLSSFQVYSGDQRASVVQICERLVVMAGLPNPMPDLWGPVLDTYEAAVAAHRPRRAQRAEDMLLWRNRIEQLLQSGRRNEVPAMRDRMYSTFGPGFRPSDVQLHDLLSKVMLDLKKFEAAREEASYALQIVGDDIDLLHRKALAELHLHQLGTALETVEKLYEINPALRANGEIAGLEGRIYRERHDSSRDPQDLEAAIDAYRRAFEADPSSYYTGVNYGALLLRSSASDRAEPILRQVLQIVEQVRSTPPISYWTDFTAGECWLGLGDVERSLAEYRTGMGRYPAPSSRDRDSAMGGVIRMAELRKLDPPLVGRFREVLQSV